MRRTTPSTYAVGLALTAVFAVAGCTSNSAPAPGVSSTPPAASTTTSASTTSIATPTATRATSITSRPSTPPTDPNVPAAAKAQTTDGAIAFTQYFFDSVNTSWTKPEAGRLPALFTPTCSSCQNFENNAAKYVRENTRYNKTPLEILEVSSHGPAVEGPKQTVDAVIHQVAASIVDASGKSVSNAEEQRGIFVSDLVWQGDGWKLTSIKVQQ